VQASLANLNGLRVIAQSSVAPYAGQGPRDIGSELRVESLVEGEVQRAGSAVRVRVRLVDAATEEVRWTQQYDHTTSDVFLIQSEVASRIAGLLRIQLAERESRSLARPPTTSPEAYDAYLRGQGRRSQANLGKPDLDSTLAWLERAVRLDPEFAVARAALAAYQISSVFLFDSDPRLLDLADQNIRRALATDSALALAWKARGDLVWTAARGWRFAEALEYTRRAVALQPSLVDAHNALGSLYFHYGFLDQARRELELSLSLDPRDGCEDLARCQGFSRPRVARVYWYRQQFDSALAVYEQMPYIGGFAWERAVVLTALGRPREALTLLDQSTWRGSAESSDWQAARGLAYAALGDTAKGLEHLEAAAARPPGRSHFHHAQFTLATGYARLGRIREAVEWLRQTADNGMPNYPLFRNDPNLQVLQGDPDYEALMTRLKAQHEEYARLVRTL
jgi:tetratricopeptide (TPR) repeat protein